MAQVNFDWTTRDNQSGKKYAYARVSGTEKNINPPAPQKTLKHLKQ